MGLGIYPVFELPLEGMRFHALGEVLAAHLDTLDEIARSARLTPLTAFADNRPIPDDFDGDPDEMAEVMGEWAEWFGPTEGRAAVQNLADHIRAGAGAVGPLEAAREVSAELEELARVLGFAASHGIRFRLEMS